MALPTRERGAQWSRGPIWLGFVCDPPGCVYDLKGALCTMALPRLEAGSDPGMIISALATANLCRRCPRALHSRHSHASPRPCPSRDLVRSPWLIRSPCALPRRSSDSIWKERSALLHNFSICWAKRREREPTGMRPKPRSGGGSAPPTPPPRDHVTSAVVAPLCGRICAALARRLGMAAAGTGGAGGHSPPGHCTHRAARTEQRCGDLPAIAQRSHHCVLFPTFARVRGRIRSVKATASLCRRGPCNAK